MSILTRLFAICAVFSVLITPSQAETKNVTIPLVPVKAIEGKRPQKKPEAPKPNELKPVSIQMQPGINEIVPIAVVHLNRVVTPFNDPDVTTVSSAEILTRDNVVYVSTAESAPVTLFITEKESETQALSLTLVPKRIPPQEVFLNLAGINGQAPGPSMQAGTQTGAYGYTHGIVNRKAARWERKHTYVDTIKKLMVSLAKKEIPRGYTMSRLDSVGTFPPPRCVQDGLLFDWSNAQALFGHRLNVTVGIAENASDRDIELLANPCFEIAAFSSWPEVYLKPGERTEIYVVRRQNEVERVTTKRPSLLGQ